MGRVIAALHKNCTDYAMPMGMDNQIFNELDKEKVEVLFEPQNSPNNRMVGTIVLVHLKCKEKMSVIYAVEKLRANPCVVAAEPDHYIEPHVTLGNPYILPHELRIIPNDTYFGYLWGLRKVKAPAAWNYSTGSPRVVVGVVDSGVDFEHPDLNANMWPSHGQGLYGWNFFDDNDNPMDQTGHGTHVAGTIGAIGNNLIGVTGVCWNVKIAALKIGNNLFSSSAAIKAIDYANKHKISILNNSWGGAYSSILKLAIENYDGLFIASAGNAGSDNDIFPVFPASFGGSNMISVAACTQNNALASFSNYGLASVDIAAPGTDIFSTSISGGYSFMDGTSMAAPYVSGAAALLKSYRPDLTNLEIKNIILSSVDRQPLLYGKILTRGTLNLSRMFEMAELPVFR